MSKKVKLPNGDTYEIPSGEEKDYVHVYVTHANGTELRQPGVRVYNTRVAKNILESGDVNGKVINDPTGKLGDVMKDAPQSSGPAAANLRNFSDDELLAEVQARNLVPTNASDDELSAKDMSVEESYSAEQYEQLTVEQLRPHLEARDLPISGLKKELIDSLVTANQND